MPPLPRRPRLAHSPFVLRGGVEADEVLTGVLRVVEHQLSDRFDVVLEPRLAKRGLHLDDRCWRDGHEEAAAALVDDTVAAVFVEPVQGEGGIHPPVINQNSCVCVCAC